jgi:hypothetical protein
MIEASKQSANVSLSTYLKRFGLVYFIAGAALAVALTLLRIDGNSGASAAVLASASYAATHKFVQDQRRPFLNRNVAILLSTQPSGHFCLQL